jgi:amino acid transporter
LAITTTPSLSRSLHRWDLIAVVLNGVIGAGIFGLPSKIFSLAGNQSILAFVTCAVCVAVIVLTFAEVASRYSGTGGPYLYARETYGSSIGFTVGWLLWVARVTSFAANCNLLPDYLDLFFPGASKGLARFSIITAVVGALAMVNFFGIRRVADASNTLALGKLIPLAVFIVAGLFFVDSSRLTFAVVPRYHTFSQAVLLLVYAFTGFEMSLIPAAEIRNPERALPRALLAGMTVVVTFYILIQVVCIGTLPGLADSKRPLADAAVRFLGPWGGVMITAGIVLSLAGNLNIIMLAASRVLFAMGERGEMPRALAKVNAQFRTPVVAIGATLAVVYLLTLSGTFIYLLTISTISRLVTYIITCGALPILRRRANAPTAAFRLPGGEIWAALSIALCLWLLSNISLQEARDSLLAILAGLVIYWFSRRPLAVS